MYNAFINIEGKPRLFVIFGTLLLFYVVFLLLILMVKPGIIIYSLLLLPLIPILTFLLINKTEWAFLLYLAIMPILQHYDLKYVSLGTFLITPDMVIQLLILIAVINKFLYTYNPDSKRRINILDKLLLLFVLMSFFSLISASAYPTDQGKRLLLYYTGIFQTVTLYFITIYFLESDHSFIERLLLALLIIPLSSGIIAMIELKDIGLNLISIFFVRNQIGFGFHNTNLFGLETALLFPIYFFALSYEKFKGYKLVIWISLITLSVLSALTLNRGTFVVIAFYFFIFVFKKENRKIILGFLILGALGIYYFSNLIVIYINRFLGSNASGANISLDESALYRIELWRVGLEGMIKYPLGLGGNGFDFVWKKYGIDSTRFWSSPHQILLHIAIDYGVPALIVFIVLYYKYFRSSSILSKLKNFDLSKLFFYIKIALIGYLIHGFLTGAEISHLSGAILPTNGYTYLLMILFAIISVYYTSFVKINTAAADIDSENIKA